MIQKEDLNGNTNFLLQDNTDNFKEEIETAFRGAINNSVIELFREQGHEITNWMADNTTGEFYRDHVLNTFLKPLGLNSFTDLVKVMGGIVGDAKFEKINEFKLSDDSRITFKDFVLTTDKYSLVRSFDTEDKAIIVNSSFVKSTDEINYSASILSNQITHATKAGFKHLIIVAEKDKAKNGYYTWLMMGYVPLSGQRFEEQLDGIIKDTEFENIESYLELLKTDKGRQFWKENGFAFKGAFDLHKDSYSTAIFEKYLETRHLIVGDIGEEFLKYHTEEELDEIYSSFTTADLNKAYENWKEHEDGRAERLKESKKSLDYTMLSVKNGTNKEDWYDEFEKEAGRYSELLKATDSRKQE